MDKPLRVLIVEDEVAAALLMVRLLQQTGLTIEYEHVESSVAYRKALEDAGWDVILCDYALPRFNAREALKIYQETGLDIPFIVVSGRIGEDIAAEMMHAGADDFVNKVNLARLLPAVQRAVADAAERRQRRIADAVRIKLDENLRNVVRENVDGMIILGEYGDILFANPAAEALLGRRQAEFLGERFGTPAFKQSSLEVQLVRSDGDLVYVELRATATEWESEPAILLSMRDITDRKDAEEHLRRLNRALTMLSHCNRILVRAHTEQELLDEVCRIVVEESDYRFVWVGLFETGDADGLNPSAWAGNGEGYLEEIAERRPARDSQLCPVWRSVRGSKPFVLQDTDAGDFDSVWRDAAARRGFRAAIALPLVIGRDVLGAFSIYARERNAFNEDEIKLLEELAGDLALGVMVLRREAGRKDAEKALRASEERFRKAIIHAPLATMVHAEDGEVLTINEAWTRITGYTHEDIPTVYDWFAKAYGERAEEVAQVMRAVYALYEPAITGEFVARTKSGADCNLIFNTAPLGRLPDGRRAIIGMASDVTEQRAVQGKLRESEEQIRQLQKLESIGRLAGGVAHDFNNILHAIGGYAEFALDEVEKGSALHQDIGHIQNLVGRASSLTQQLLAFSRKQTLQAEVLDLNVQIDESLKLLHRLIGEDIELAFYPEENLAPVHADPGQIYQVIMNLAVNARDAMPRGGKVTVETSNRTIDDSYAESHPGIVPGNYVLMSISDTGTGMDGETMANVFEPFFTTKESGCGTGLGLSTVYGIVKQHGGDILVYSEIGRGSTFKIYLPYAEKRLALVLSDTSSVELHGHGETILVAEDEAAIRYVVTRFLTAFGYAVIAAADGEAAIEEARRHTGEIDLLVTDVVMPGMGGRELHKQLQYTRPHLRVLYMSGYTDDAIVRHGVLQDGTPFLQKPFGSSDLLNAVSRVLNGATAAHQE